MKNKNVAAVLALTLGMYGVHRFYLGQQMRGIAHLSLGILGVFVLANLGSPLIILPTIIGLMDAVLLFAMSKEEFDQRYNFHNIKSGFFDRSHPYNSSENMESDYQEESYNTRPSSRPAYFKEDYREEDIFYNDRKRYKKHPFKTTGVAKFNQYDYEGAIRDFQRALKDLPRDASLHFNIACAYSMKGEVMIALYHLDKAIENGYEKFDKIHRHASLKTVRKHPEFQRFVDNDYQLREKFEVIEDSLDEEPEGLELDSLIEQIKKLGELRDKGILNEEEFKEQKKRLL